MSVAPAFSAVSAVPTCSARRQRGMASMCAQSAAGEPKTGATSPSRATAAGTAAPIGANATANSARRFCGACGSTVELSIPDGDTRERAVCGKCERVWYENPTPTVLAVAVSADRTRVLLARRALPPVGTWCLPGGFLEVGEAAEAGAAREAWEEAGAELAPEARLLAVYTVLPAAQLQLVYRATLLNEKRVEAGPESMDVRMFGWDELPWDELSFPTVAWALAHARDTLAKTVPPPQLRTKLPDGSFIDVPS